MLPILLQFAYKSQDKHCILYMDFVVVVVVVVFYLLVNRSTGRDIEICTVSCLII